MDHISKALERTREEQKSRSGGSRNSSVRDWVRPSSNRQRPQLEDFDAEKTVLDPRVLKQNLVLGPHDDPVILDRYRLLRTRMLQLMLPNDWHSVGITSAGARDGKTLTAINLAFAIARDGTNRVILLDTDLRRPAVGQTLGIEPERGVIDYLRGQAELKDISLAVNGEPNLLVLPGRRDDEVRPEPELMNSSKMDELFADIRELDSQAIVIVDFPPILIGDDVIALAPRLDSMLLVVAEGQTDIDELTASVELLSSFNLLGTVLNKSTEKVRTSEGYYSYYNPEDAEQDH